jgi:UDP-N-acetylglucosamine 2-epimerase (non-hydrolysing)
MRVLSIFGTRPEAIKMAPVVRALEREPGVSSLVCVTGQHRQMLDQVLDLFAVRADYDLNIMAQDQTLNGMLGKIVAGLDEVLADARPDRVLVHGDTTTALAATLAAFHRRIPIGHVEAGLRTYDLAKPWPEEMNRRVVDLASDLMFAPTAGARDNLLQEKLSGRIVVTGNTVIDALMSTAALLDGNSPLRQRVDAGLPVIAPGRRLVLVTGHRRESFGDGFRNICEALQRLAARGDIEIVYPVHLNPNVRGPVLEVLGEQPNIHLLLPQDYLPFVRLMQRADLVLTDSGGVQEEAPFLGKPVLVMRDVTERPEAVRAGAARLVGTGADSIVRNVERVLDGDDAAGTASWRTSPYGDGVASGRIVDAILGRSVNEFESIDRAANDLAA